ncbi:MAG TPA: HWE histidine kinase domain-containing protein [Caulobacteraceae bacterium]
MADVALAPGPASAASDFRALAGLDQSALDALPAAVYICAADGRVVRYNRRAAEFWGRRPRPGDTDERFCGAFRLYHLDGRSLPHDQCPMAAVLRTGEPARDIEVVIERPDGGRITTLANIEPLLDAEGKVEGAINCLQDITGRKASEDRLRDSESRWRELLEALPTAVYTTDAAGRITFFNEAAVQFWGHRPTLGESEWCGSWRLFTADGAPLPHDQCPMAIALKEDRSIRNVEAVAERPDGARIPFVPYPTPLHDASGALTGAVNMLVDISSHKEAEGRQRLLINELNHRVKNSLANVQAIVAQTLRRADDLQSAREAVDERLIAIARAHDVLTQESWRGAGIRDVVRSSLMAHCADIERLDLDGPDVRLTPKAALALAMALHELGANALRYGALANDQGRVSVAWRREIHDGGAHLRLEWRESGGEPVTAPTHKGFGARLIEWGLAGELGGEAELSFPPEGARCRIDVPLGPAL